jgi:hypothetical protein
MFDVATGKCQYSSSNEKSINTCLGLLFTTIKSEMFGNPKFGTNITKYMFNHNIEATNDIITTEILNAIDMFGNISSGPVKNGVVVSGAVGIDVEPPKFSGSVAEVSLIKKAQGSYEFSWPGATDNIKVREYEYKVDVLFGANVIPWTKTTNLKTTVSGLSNGNYVVHIKANDTSGNVQINDKNGNQMMRQLTVN